MGGMPQFDPFQALFFDLVAGQVDWPDSARFLDVAGWTEPAAFAARFGFNVPADVLERHRVLQRIDEDRTLRKLGFLGFTTGAIPDWDAIRFGLGSLEAEFTRDFGAGCLRIARRGG